MAGFEISVDDGGLTAALAKAVVQVPVAARDEVKKSGDRLKSAMRDDAAKSRYFRFAGRITSEAKGNGFFSSVEVGPERGGAGSLAHIAYFGGAHGGGGTVRDPKLALADESVHLEKALGDVLGKAL